MITTLSGRPAAPLGLADCPEQQRACVRVAREAGVNYFFFYSLGQQALLEGLTPVLRRSREHVIVATGSGARSRKGLEKVRRATCRRLGVDTLDVFFAEYVDPPEHGPKVFDNEGVLDLLSEWRESGAIRFVGASAHDRELAHRLVDDGRIDVLMHRYNMAHRKAASSVFPAAAAAGIPIVAFTATRWRTLLNGHPEWQGPVPTAADCYRYCLTAPAVQLVLSAPRTTTQLRSNLAVLEGRPAESRATDWDAYGDLVYADGRGRFDAW
jgi:aryl-alcohol dehydrogenase-like predicted oxidoreductase